MSSEIVDDIKRTAELARAQGYMEGLRDMTAELEHYMIPAVRIGLMTMLADRYQAAHPELKEPSHG